MQLNSHRPSQPTSPLNIVHLREIRLSPRGSGRGVVETNRLGLSLEDIRISSRSRQAPGQTHGEINSIGLPAHDLRRIFVPDTNTRIKNGDPALSILPSPFRPDNIHVPRRRESLSSVFPRALSTRDSVRRSTNTRQRRISSKQMDQNLLLLQLLSSIKSPGQSGSSMLTNDLAAQRRVSQSRNSRIDTASLNNQELIRPSRRRFLPSDLDKLPRGMRERIRPLGGATVNTKTIRPLGGAAMNTQSNRLRKNVPEKYSLERLVSLLREPDTKRQTRRPLRTLADLGRLRRRNNRRDLDIPQAGSASGRVLESFGKCYLYMFCFCFVFIWGGD